MRGLGTDIIEISRIQEAIDKQPSFLCKVYTPQERAYCQQFAQSFRPFAARFCAKEAVAKALGVGIGSQLDWLDIEILKDPKGKPYVELSAAAKAHLDTKGLFFLSLSHEKSYAIATAIWLQ